MSDHQVVQNLYVKAVEGQVETHDQKVALIERNGDTHFKSFCLPQGLVHHNPKNDSHPERPYQDYLHEQM